MRKSVAVPFFAVAVALSACDEGAITEIAQSGPSNQAQGTAAEPGQEIREEEREFFDLERTLPGFGGYIFDADGNLVAWVKGRTREKESQAKAILEGILESKKAALGGHRGQVQVRDAAYSFTELAGWRDRMRLGILGAPGVVFLDADEEANRVVVGVSNEEARSKVVAFVAQAGIPPAAVAVHAAGGEPSYGMSEPATQVGQSGSLKDQSRPMMSGMYVTWDNWKDGQRYGCTIGLIGIQNGQTYAVTNAHCSTIEWRTEATVYSYGAFRATEAKDPRSSDNCGLFWVYYCRNADASMFPVGGASAQMGRIANPQLLNETADGYLQTSDDPQYLTIDPANPSLRISATAGQSTVGDIVYKVGARTGKTRGTVGRTCVDTNAVEGGHRYYCQHWARYGNDFGDSGAPVFRVNADGTATLAGIHWAKRWDALWYAVYSPYRRIERDLGSIQVIP